jgi:hypothetical protein
MVRLVRRISTAHSTGADHGVVPGPARHADEALTDSRDLAHNYPAGQVANWLCRPGDFFDGWMGAAGEATGRHAARRLTLDV